MIRHVPAALFGIAAPAVAQPASLVPNPAFQPFAAEVQAACPAQYPPPWDTPQLLHHVQRLGGLIQGIGEACPPNPALALRIAEAVADRPARLSGLAYHVLAQLHERGIGTAPDPARALAYRRRSWLLILARDTEPPFTGEAELDAYVARPETIDFLSRFAEVPDLPRARLRLARALFLRGRPEDHAQGVRLLDDPALAGEAEATFVRARGMLASGVEGNVRRRAIGGLRSLARGNYPEAHIMLAALARRQLADARLPEERWDAIGWLGDLAFQGDAERRAALLLQASAANGGLPPPRLTGPAAERLAPALAASFSDDDYPAAALRAAESGVVRLEGLVDPRGRIIYTEPGGTVESRSLVAAMRRIYASRRRPGTDLGDARIAPYMWVPLPPVTFTFLGLRRGSMRYPFSPPQR